MRVCALAVLLFCQVGFQFDTRAFFPFPVNRIQCFLRLPTGTHHLSIDPESPVPFERGHRHSVFHYSSTEQMIVSTLWCKAQVVSLPGIAAYGVCCESGSSPFHRKEE